MVKRSFIFKMTVRYVFEIILVIAFMIVSYKGFTMNNLSEARQIASLSSKETREIQAVYSYGSKEGSTQLADRILVNKGMLALRNPNRTQKEFSVVIQIRKSDNYGIGDLDILVDGVKANMGIVMNLEEIYEVNLGQISLEAYEQENLDIEIFSCVGNIPVEYSFKLVGSF